MSDLNQSAEMRAETRDAFNELKQVFKWSCPNQDHQTTGTVTCDGERAVCDVCGQTNHPLDVPEVNTVLVIAHDRYQFEQWCLENQPSNLDLASAWCDFGRCRYKYVRTPSYVQGFDHRFVRCLLLDYEMPQVEFRQAVQKAGYRKLAIPRQWRVYSWAVGCEFRRVATGQVLKGSITVTSTDLRQVEEIDPPRTGTCSTKVSGIWYGNAEIKDYILNQKAWLPHSGLFGLTPESGQQSEPGDTHEIGWFKNRKGD